MSEYVITINSTSDLPKEWVWERKIPVVPLNCTIGGNTYRDMYDLTAEEFYGMLENGEMAVTSQPSPQTAIDILEPILKKGKDILHLSFTSGLSGTYNSMCIAAEELREKYPERKLVVIDSLCSSSGYGLLVDAAADMRDAGKSLDETAEWVTANCNKVHHQFYSTELKFYRRSGRMSGATATIATILDICPIMRLDDKGKIIAYGKVRGKKNAVKETIRTMEQHAQGGVNYSGKCFICHSNCPAEAEATRQAVAEHFPHIQGDIRVNEIGTIIASHCGPGTVAVFFFGDERQPDTSGK